MHYIRFLKAPKIEVEKSYARVKVLITITNDLGDDFLAAKLPIYAHLTQDGHGARWESKLFRATASSTWRPGLRSLWLVLSNLPTSALETSLRLLISTSSGKEKTSQVPYAALNSLPNVLHAWSEPFNLTGNGTMKWVERRFEINETVTLRICEETGESIARHIWDAGVVLAAFIRDAVLLPSSRAGNSAVARRLRVPSGLKVIELCSGCGIVGLQLAHVCPKAQVLLTDLPEAMEVLEQNISCGTFASDSEVSKAVLDWDESVPKYIAEQVFDLVVVSDCTYNADSLPALVQTIAILLENSPEALVVVAMKVRHASEAIFHTLMEKADLHECSHWAIETPSALDASFCQDAEMVDIYAYGISQKIAKKDAKKTKAKDNDRPFRSSEVLASF